MFYMGIDIGAVTAKAVILQGNGVRAVSVMDTGSNIKKVADRITEETLKKAMIRSDQLQRIVATGYGRISVDFATDRVTEITCHAKGVHHLIPEVKTIIDIGGQDSKVIRIDKDGTVTDFVMNDKCAAGTGRFLEVMAKALEISVEKLGPTSLESTKPCSISSVCTVFAESEVVSLRAEGHSREDIIAGIHKSIASRIRAMMAQTGHINPVVLTGGVAKNAGLVKALEDELQTSLSIPEDPQITGALGAALIGSRTCT